MIDKQVHGLLNKKEQGKTGSLLSGNVYIRIQTKNSSLYKMSGTVTHPCMFRSEIDLMFH